MLLFLLFFLCEHSLSSDTDFLEKRNVFAVNCGGPLHKGYGGLVYVADLLSSGAFDSNYGQVYNFTKAVPEDRELYKTERYAPDTFGYAFPTPENGRYILLLKFSEVYYDKPGMFHVAVNDFIILNNFDIFQHTQERGGIYEKRFAFYLRNGTMTILGTSVYVGQQMRILFHKGKAENPMANAVAVLKGGLEGLPPLPTDWEIGQVTYMDYKDEDVETLCPPQNAKFFTPKQCCQFCEIQNMTVHPFHFNPLTTRCSEFFETDDISSADYVRVLSSHPEECCTFCGEESGEFYYKTSEGLYKPGICAAFANKGDEMPPSQCSLCEALVSMLLTMDTKEVDVLKFELIDTCEKAQASKRLCKELIDEHGDTLIIAAHSNISTLAICTFMVKMCDDKEVEYPIKGLLPKRREYYVLKPVDLRRPVDLLALPELTPQNLDQFIGMNDTQSEGRRRTLAFLAQYGVISNEMICPVQECSTKMSLVEGALEHKWRCEGCRRANRAGSHKLSIRTGTIFAEDDLRLLEVLKTMARWATSKGKAPSKEAEVRWHNIFRDVCEAWFIRKASSVKIGGTNKTVEIGDTVIYQEKYTGGKRTRKGKRALGAIEWDLNKMAFTFLESNSSDCDSFIDAINEILLPDTTLVFDNWTSYCELSYLQLQLPNMTFLETNGKEAYEDVVATAYLPLKATLRNETGLFPHWFHRYHGNKKIMNQLLVEIIEQYAKLGKNK